MATSPSPPTSPPAEPLALPPGIEQPAFRIGRATSTVFFTLSPSIRTGIEDTLEAKFGRRVAVPATFGSAELASLIQKGNRAGDPADVREALSLAAALWEAAADLLRDDALDTGKTSTWQSVTTFLFGRLVICLFEDSAASPEAVGATIALAKHLVASNPPRPNPKRDRTLFVVEWLEARNAVILDGIKRMATVALMTPRRFRAASLACCPLPGGALPWPKEPSAKAPQPTEPITDTPVKYKLDKSYAANCQRILRKAFKEVNTPAVDPGTKSILHELFVVAQTLAGCYDPAALAALPPAERAHIVANKRNEAHMFPWYAWTVAHDPALHPPPGSMVLPPLTDFAAGPAPRLTVALAMRFLDQHCGGPYKGLGFHPADTMGPGNDIHSAVPPEDAPIGRRWLANRHAAYCTRRAAANRVRLEAAREGRSTSRKRTAPGAAGRPAKRAAPRAQPVVGHRIDQRRIDLDAECKRAVPGQRSTHPGAGAEAAFGNGRADRGKEWVKGPYPEADMHTVDTRGAMLAQCTPAAVLGTPAEFCPAPGAAPELYLLYPHVGHASPAVRDGSEPVPQAVERWTSKGGAPKEQLVADWHTDKLVGVPMSRLVDADAVRAGRFDPVALADVLYDYLIILLGRALCGIGDNAPRNTLLRLDGPDAMPHEVVAGRTGAAVTDAAIDWWLASSRRLASIDYDKSAMPFGTPAELWSVAVAKKHSGRVATALHAVLIARAADLHSHFSAVSMDAIDTHRVHSDTCAMVERHRAILLALLADPAAV